MDREKERKLGKYRESVNMNDEEEREVQRSLIETVKVRTPRPEKYNTVKLD